MIRSPFFDRNTTGFIIWSIDVELKHKALYHFVTRKDDIPVTVFLDVITTQVSPEPDISSSNIFAVHRYHS